MELGVSALTRRDRLERIASAERDRRAGRAELAIAVLGEGSEWPARVVLALAKLPPGEGAESRGLLEESLDIWAADIGLEPLVSHARHEDRDEESHASRASDSYAVELESSADSTFHSASDSDSGSDPEPELDLESEPDLDAGSAEEPILESEWAIRASEEMVLEGNLDAPIDNSELDRAFAEAEAQTDEMHDANRVAERVLMAEAVGLTELSGDAIRVLGEEGDSPAPDDQSETDAAWALIPNSAAKSTVTTSTWPELIPREEAAYSAVLDEASPIDRGTAHGGVLETLERWLANLEHGRAGRSR